MSSTTMVAEMKKIRKYMDQLKQESKVSHALRKLHQQTPTAAVLAETGVEKAVQGLVGHAEQGLVARLLLAKWKAVVSSETSKSRKRPADAMAAPLLLRVKQEPASFDAPLPAKKQKAFAPATAPSTASTPMSEETDGLLALQRIKTQPTVYSGKLKTCVNDENNSPPRLSELMQKPARCTYLEAASTIQRCTAQQLERVEKLNPRWRQDTESIWQKLCLKDFKGAECEPGDDGSWRACYQRHVMDRDDKLSAFIAKFYKKCIG